MILSLLSLHPAPKGLDNASIGGRSRLQEHLLCCIEGFGGTTTVIPRQGEHQEMAWAFTRFLYLDREQTVQRSLKTRVMPALHESYEDPRLLEDRFAYLGGQQLGRLFAELRNQIPPVYLHSSWTEASTQLGTVILRAIQQEERPAVLLHEYRQYLDGIMARYASIEAVLREGR